MSYTEYFFLQSPEVKYHRIRIYSWVGVGFQVGIGFQFLSVFKVVSVLDVSFFSNTAVLVSVFVFFSPSNYTIARN
jgi:hypothetical protein